MNIEKESTCCFTGHRDIPSDLAGYLLGRVMDGINCLYRHGVKTFLAGGAVGFDTLAAQAVLKCKEAHPDICLILVIPCRDQAKYWKQDDRNAYESIKELADGTVCLSEHYHRGCMQQRNRYMVDHSCTCMCYLTQSKGGTAYTVGYAKSRGVAVFNLAIPNHR